MSEPVWWEEALRYIASLPVSFAYRIIWLTAKLGSRNAQDVHQAMWDANLNVPPLKECQKSNH